MKKEKGKIFGTVKNTSKTVISGNVYDQTEKVKVINNKKASSKKNN